jgi:pectate lyase
MMIASFRKRSFQFWAVVLTVLLTTTALVVLPVALTQAAADDPLVGFGEGTTGGAGGTTVTISTLDDLKRTLRETTPVIVNISGIISGAENLTVMSDKTIQGVDAHSGLKGLSLSLKGVNNVIIRNLILSDTLESATNGDEIHLEQATHVWIDHNDLFEDVNPGSSDYDGLIDITHGSDNITVSWNRLHDHYKSSLVGHADDNAAEDTGHLHVTYHHNWFYKVSARTPSLRFGTGHVFNNYFQDIDVTAVHSRMGAQMLVENNVFRNVAIPVITTTQSIQDGYANISGNDFGGGTPNITQVGTFTKAPYNCTLDETSSVIDKVTAHSGVIG